MKIVKTRLGKYVLKHHFNLQNPYNLSFYTAEWQTFFWPHDIRDEKRYQ